MNYKKVERFLYWPWFIIEQIFKLRMILYWTKLPKWFGHLLKFQFSLSQIAFGIFLFWLVWTFNEYADIYGSENIYPFWAMGLSRVLTVVFILTILRLMMEDNGLDFLYSSPDEFMNKYERKRLYERLIVFTHDIAMIVISTTLGVLFSKKNE